MPDPKSDELRKLHFEVSDAMRSATEQVIAAIYGIESATRGKLVGSGTFIQYDEAAFLLTVEHVAERILSHERLAHRTTYGAKPAIIRNPMFSQKLPLDVAFV